MDNDYIKELGYSSENSDSLIKLCQDRKSLGWEIMKGWNDSVRQQIQVTLEFINQLYERVSKLTKKSSDRIEIVTQFLEKMSIVLKSEVHLKDHLGLFSIEQAANSDSLEKIKRSRQRENEPILYAMSEFNREYAIFNEKLEDMRGRVKTGIIDKILRNQVTSQTKILENKYKHFSTLKKGLLKWNNKMVDKVKKLNKCFEEQKLPKERSKRTKINTFDAAKEFVESAKNVEMTLSYLGKVLIEIWNQCIILEENRLSSIREAMVKFLDILTEVYGAEAQRTFKNR